MHLTDADLGLLLLGADATDESNAVLIAHAGQCADCGARLGELHSTLELLDRLVPAVDHPVPHRTMPTHAPSRVPRLAVAAGLLVVTAALAAAATTGTLSRWVSGLRHPASIARHTVTNSVRGVEVMVDSAVTVDFSAQQRRGTVRVREGRPGYLTITASADGPRYAIRRNHVSVGNTPSDSASYDVSVPPPPAIVTVAIAGHVVFPR